MKYLAPAIGGVLGAAVGAPVSLLASAVLAVHLPHYLRIPPAEVFQIVQRPALLACCTIGATAGMLVVLTLRGRDYAS